MNEINILKLKDIIIKNLKIDDYCLDIIINFNFIKELSKIIDKKILWKWLCNLKYEKVFTDELVLWEKENSEKIYFILKGEVNVYNRCMEYNLNELRINKFQVKNKKIKENNMFYSTKNIFKKAYLIESKKWKFFKGQYKIINDKIVFDSMIVLLYFFKISNILFDKIKGIKQFNKNKLIMNIFNSLKNFKYLFNNCLLNKNPKNKDNISIFFPNFNKKYTLKEFNNFGGNNLLSNKSKNPWIYAFKGTEFLTIDKKYVNIVLNEFYTKNFNDIKLFFQNFDWFSYWEKNDKILELNKLFINLTFKYNQVIYNFGDPVEGLYFLKKGEILIYYEQENRKKSLNYFKIKNNYKLVEPNLFGEFDLEDEYRKTKVVSNYSKTKIWFLSLKNIERINEICKEFHSKLNEFKINRKLFKSKKKNIKIERIFKTEKKTSKIIYKSKNKINFLKIKNKSSKALEEKNLENQIKKKINKIKLEIKQEESEDEIDLILTKYQQLKFIQIPVIKNKKIINEKYTKVFKNYKIKKPIKNMFNSGSLKKNYSRKLICHSISKNKYLLRKMKKII